jgi:hypothetical protein
MSITFTKPVVFKTGTVPYVAGASYKWYRTVLSSGLSVVGVVYSFAPGFGYMSNFVCLFEDVTDQNGAYTTVYGSPTGYQCNSINEALMKIGFIEAADVSLLWCDGPITEKKKVPVAAIQRCSCGFVTDYEIVCEGTYSCKNCLYWKDCYDKKK